LLLREKGVPARPHHRLEMICIKRIYRFGEPCFTINEEGRTLNNLALSAYYLSMDIQGTHSLVDKGLRNNLN